MTKDEALKIANDMAFMASIWVDDEGDEVNDLIELICRVEAITRKATLEEIIYSHPAEAIKKAVEYEREHCATRASIALLGTLKSTSDRVLRAIRHRGES